MQQVAALSAELEADRLELVATAATARAGAWPVPAAEFRVSRLVRRTVRLTNKAATAAALREVQPSVSGAPSGSCNVPVKDGLSPFKVGFCRP